MRTSTAVLLSAVVLGGAQAVFLFSTTGPAPAPAPQQTQNKTPAASPTLSTAKPQPRTIVSTAPPADKPAALSTTNFPANLPTADTPEPETDPDAPMSREELERRARIVQDQTQQRLETLTRDLNLTGEQQDYLFGVIARSSPSYVPALNVGYVAGGTTTGGDEFTPIKSGSSDRTPSPVISSSQPANNASFTTSSSTDLNDKIYEVLAPDQQDAFEEELMDRERWWADIIGELEEEHDELIAGEPVVTTPPATTEPATPDQEITTGEDGESTEQTGGGGNLFDLLNGN